MECKLEGQCTRSCRPTVRCRFLAGFTIITSLYGSLWAETGEPSSTSIQRLIDENPGGVIELDKPEYLIHDTLIIKHNGTILRGSGKIVFTNPAVPILRIQDASHVRLKGLTLTRSKNK